MTDYNYIELSYYSYNKTTVWLSMFFSIWMFGMLFFVSLLFRRDLCNYYNICDPIVMNYLDRRICYKKIESKLNSDYTINREIALLEEKAEERKQKVDELYQSLEDNEAKYNKMIKDTKRTVLSIKDSIVKVKDMYLANTKTLSTMYSTNKKRIYAYLSGIRSVLQDLQKQYSTISILNARAPTSVNAKIMNYLEKTYSALYEMSSMNSKNSGGPKIDVSDLPREIKSPKINAVSATK